MSLDIARIPLVHARGSAQIVRGLHISLSCRFMPKAIVANPTEGWSVVGGIIGLLTTCFVAGVLAIFISFSYK